MGLLFFLMVMNPSEAEFKMNWENLQAFLKTEKMEMSVDAVVRFYMGRPYLVASLEGEGPETLTCHLDGFDCFTLTEAAVALCLLKEPSLNAYEELILKTRYRNGVLDGYESRIHYATEWSDQAVTLGYLADVTQHLKGAQKWEKVLNFMTQHRGLYPKLQNDEVFIKIQEIERRLSDRVRTYLPVARLEENHAFFKPGDILMILTQKEGLDVGHFCYVIQNGQPELTNSKIQMVHASSTQNEIVQEGDMFEYIRRYPKVLGIMVFRLKKG